MQATLSASNNRQIFLKYIAKEDIHRQNLSHVFPAFCKPFSSIRWHARSCLLTKDISYSLDIIANSSKRFYELATLHAFKNRQTLSKYIVKEDIHRQKLSCTFPIIGEPFASIAKSPLLKNPCRSRRE